MEKLIIATIEKKGDWHNLVDNKAREISCFVGKEKDSDKLANPVSNKILEGASNGSEVEVNVVPGKNGKLYIFDPKGGSGGSKFPPKNQNLECAKIALQAAATTHSLTKDSTPEKVLETAKKYQEWLLTFNS